MDEAPSDVAEMGALSPDGGLLAVLTMDENMMLLLDPKVVKKPDPADVRMCDGKTIRLIDTTTGKELRRVEGRIDMDVPFTPQRYCCTRADIDAPDCKLDARRASDPGSPAA